MSIMEYLNKVESISDQLAAVGCEMSDNDKARRTLDGLGPEYHLLATSLQNFPSLLKISFAI